MLVHQSVIFRSKRFMVPFGPREAMRAYTERCEAKLRETGEIGPEQRIGLVLAGRLVDPEELCGKLFHYSCIHAILVNTLE